QFIAPIGRCLSPDQRRAAHSVFACLLPLPETVRFGLPPVSGSNHRGARYFRCPSAPPSRILYFQVSLVTSILCSVGRSPCGLELALNRVLACKTVCVMNLYVLWKKFLSYFIVLSILPLII